LDVNNTNDDTRVSRFWSKINLMAEIAFVFRNNPPGRAVFMKALEMVRMIVAFESATLYLYDQNKNSLLEECTCGEKTEPLDIDYLLADRDFTDWIVKQKRPVLSSDLEDIGKSLHSDKGVFLIIPLLIEEKLIGVIYFIGSSKDAFLKKDIKLLDVVSDQIAISIERSIYQRRLEKKNLDLLETQQKLREARKKTIDDERLNAVKELAASINHNINNPLSVITGNIEYILFKHKDLDESIKNRLKTMESEAMRISDINRRLLEIHQWVTEPYLKEGDGVRMVDLKKSTTGYNNG
jgi:K+-sensing histidine kinase KdpD